MRKPQRCPTVRKMREGWATRQAVIGGRGQRVTMRRVM
jgi:hypothetical protein